LDDVIEAAATPSGAQLSPLATRITFLAWNPTGERTGGLEERSLTMLDYRPSQCEVRCCEVGDKLTARGNFGTGTAGICRPEDATTAVCVRGNELAFTGRSHARRRIPRLGRDRMTYQTAIFRQVNKDQIRGCIRRARISGWADRPLTELVEGQEATVMQLPAQPRHPPRRRLRGE